jgi:hypothetical protein
MEKQQTGVLDAAELRRRRAERFSEEMERARLLGIVAIRNGDHHAHALIRITMAAALGLLGDEA